MTRLETGAEKRNLDSIAVASRSLALTHKRLPIPSPRENTIHELLTHARRKLKTMNDLIAESATQISQFLTTAKKPKHSLEFTARNNEFPLTEAKSPRRKDSTPKFPLQEVSSPTSTIKPVVLFRECALPEDFATAELESPELTEEPRKKSRSRIYVKKKVKHDVTQLEIPEEFADSSYQTPPSKMSSRSLSKEGCLHRKNNAAKEKVTSRF
eukprot:TRINITY_DN5430_c0_g2_i1.p1 TRINITY_DN5430_c0_g2~~TRINITY_DN5430_c0_g2_i1.p1  ORF type:complete len:212 (-),score=33.00 TRINITY_DN5430_c0_g2_i1:116-751(-)